MGLEDAVGFMGFLQDSVFSNQNTIIAIAGAFLFIIFFAIGLDAYIKAQGG